MKSANNENQLRYFAYLRKSTEGEERQALSIESQTDKVKEIFGDLEIVEYIEEKRSAFTPHNRPEFTKMIERIRRGDADGIIAWHPDRLSRNEIEGAEITYMIRKGEIKDLKFGSYNFDNSPEGIWMLQMALSQSQYFSAKLGKDVKRGLEKKLKLGWRPGVAAAGYLNDKVNTKGEKKIVPDPKRFPLVRKMWDLMLTGNYTPPKILEIANNEWGYTTLKRKKQGGKPLSRTGIYKIFTNPFYCGLIAYGGQLVPGKHKPMITEEEYDRVQQLLGRKGKPKPKTHEFAFTGFIRCAECGCLYTAEDKYKYIKSTGETKKYIYYHCTRKRKDYKCSQKKNIPLKALEDQIEAKMKNWAILPQFQQWALEVLRERNELEVEERSAIQETKYKEILKTQADLDNLNRAKYRQEIDDEDFYTREKNMLKKRLFKLKGEARDTEERAEKWEELTEKTFNFATYARVWFENGDLMTKKEILMAMGQNPEIKGEELSFDHIFWLAPIAAEYPKLEAEYRRLELTGNDTFTDLNKAQMEALTSIRTHWRRERDSNP